MAVINDLSGSDRCSLGVAIPIINAMGIHCCAMPTAILSNHTGYDEYYFDFSDKQSEYHLDPAKARRLVQKNGIKQSQLWLVHIQSVQALKLAQQIGMQVAEEEQTKLAKIEKKQAKKAEELSI